MSFDLVLALSTEVDASGLIGGFYSGFMNGLGEVSISTVVFPPLAAFTGAVSTDALAGSKAGSFSDCFSITGGTVWSLALSS